MQYLIQSPKCTHLTRLSHCVFPLGLVYAKVTWKCSIHPSMKMFHPSIHPSIIIILPHKNGKYCRVLSARFHFYAVPTACVNDGSSAKKHSPHSQWLCPWEYDISTCILVGVTSVRPRWPLIALYGFTHWAIVTWCPSHQNIKCCSLHLLQSIKFRLHVYCRFFPSLLFQYTLHSG